MGKINLEEIKNKSVQIKDVDYSYIDGKFLRNLRMSLNMSQSLLADYLGVSKKAIEKWEQGKNKINGPTTRIIFLIDRNPQILSLLKEVKVENEIVVFNKADFISEELTNSYEIVNTDKVNLDKSIDNQTEWNWTFKKRKEGFNYVN